MTTEAKWVVAFLLPVKNVGSVHEYEPEFDNEEMGSVHTDALKVEEDEVVGEIDETVLYAVGANKLGAVSLAVRFMDATVSDDPEVTVEVLLIIIVTVSNDVDVMVDVALIFVEPVSDGAEVMIDVVLNIAVEV